MSHTVTVDVEMRDREARRKAAEDLGASIAEHTSARLYERGQEYHGCVIRLPGWTYPIIITEDNKLHYDHYQGRWGNPELLDRFCQRYTHHVTMEELEALQLQYPGASITTREENGEEILELEIPEVA